MSGLGIDISSRNGSTIKGAIQTYAPINSGNKFKSRTINLTKNCNKLQCTLLLLQYLNNNIIPLVKK